MAVAPEQNACSSSGSRIAQRGQQWMALERQLPLLRVGNCATALWDFGGSGPHASRSARHGDSAESATSR